MSSRPRPVTATVTKPPSMVQPTGVSRRKYSLSSGSSTESLISILNHDSYTSPLPSEDEKEMKENTEKLKLDDKEKGDKDMKNNKNNRLDDNRQEDDNITTYSESYTETFTEDVTTTADTRTESEPQNVTLSPWEKWLLQKVKLERQTQQKLVEEKRRLQEKQKLEEQEKHIKSKHCKVKVNNWIQEKTTQQKRLLEKQLEKQRLEAENELKKKREIEEAAQKKFEEWKEQKKQENLERLNKLKEESLRKEKEREEKNKKSQKAYEEWCEKAKSRPRTAPHSFGYTQGRLTGYHDTSAYAAPSFYNPIPWQPIHIPQPSHAKKVKAKRKPFNRYKYF